MAKKIELKRVSYNKRLSQETFCYAADIWIDGVKRGTVQNEGHGGASRIEPYELEKELDVYAATLPPLPPMFGGGPLQQDADLFLGGLLERHLAEKDLKRLFKTKTVFTGSDGKIYEVKGSVAPSDAVKVLNRMPMEAAIDLFIAP